MQVYTVGGYVRDTLMGHAPKDQDFVVVGSTTEEMLGRGFKQVGADFPVFLHPKTGDEYALARTERKTGEKYTDFVTETNGVSLKQDLARRDLTVNAMAMGHGESGGVLDPFGGQKDLRDKVLRHVTDEGFVEDPLRVLRLARFCAKFPDFSVDPKTADLCRKMVADGMLNHLTAERVGNEMVKALGEPQPVRFFVFLHMVGALEVVFPELFELVGVPAGSYKWHPEGDSFTHTMLVVQQAANELNALATQHPMRDPMREVVLFCALTHDLGKGTTPKHLLPKHFGHEARGVPLVNAMCDRLKLSNDLRKYATMVAEFHTHVHNVFKLNPKTVVKLADRMRVSHDHRAAYMLTTVSRADARGRGPFFEHMPYPNALAMQYALDATRVTAAQVCTEEELKNVPLLKNKLLHARIKAVKSAMDMFK